MSSKSGLTIVLFTASIHLMSPATLFHYFMSISLSSIPSSHIHLVGLLAFSHPFALQLRLWVLCSTMVVMRSLHINRCGLINSNVGAYLYSYTFIIPYNLLSFKVPNILRRIFFQDVYYFIICHTNYPHFRSTAKNWPYIKILYP